MNQKLPVLLFLLLLNAIYPKSTAVAQSQGSSPQSSSAMDGWNDAPNRWQLTAIDPRSQVDTVNATVRAQRNAYWKVPLEATYNASKNAAGTAGGGEVFFRDRPELPEVEGAIWILATFQTFHVFTIDSDFHLVYTEINLHVDKVISRPPSSHLAASAVIDIGSPGGTTMTPDNRTIRSNVTRQERSFQLGHRYLLLVTQDRQLGGEFTFHKRWDITSGRVLPDSLQEISRAERGESALNGMSVPELVDYLSRQLPNAGGK